MPKALIIVTSADKLNEHPTGYWLEEVAAPYLIFKNAGFEVDIASPNGGTPPLDNNSVAKDMLTEDTTTFTADQEAQEKINNTLTLGSLDAATYDIIFAAGGHGTVVDFPNSAVSRALVTAYTSGNIAAAVCHGPTSFIGANLPDGTPLVSGKKVAAFTNEEEGMTPFAKTIPFLLQDELTKLGAKWEGGAAWSSYSVVDGRLVTGQNPQSSAATAKNALEAYKNK